MFLNESKDTTFFRFILSQCILVFLCARNSALTFVFSIYILTITLWDEGTVYSQRFTDEQTKLQKIKADHSKPLLIANEKLFYGRW